MVSYLHFCGKCGEVYSRIQRGEGDNWQAVRGRCQTCGAECPFWSWPGGSVWMDWCPEFNYALPADVVQREFKLHLEEMENSEYSDRS